MGEHINAAGEFQSDTSGAPAWECLKCGALRAREPEVEEPTTAVESPQAKKASSKPPAEDAKREPLGPEPDAQVLGWHYVCDACLGDESVKTIGVVACPEVCQCCHDASLTPRTANPVTATQLARILKRASLERDIEPRGAP